MICIVALVIFSVLSIFSAKYRALAKMAFRCFTQTVMLKPCDVGLEDMIKSKMTSKLMPVPALARFFYRNFKVISWILTLSFFLSLGYSLYALYNLAVYGSCSPGEPCVLTPVGWCMLEVEKNLAFVVIGILAVSLAYYAVKKNGKRKNPGNA